LATMRMSNLVLLISFALGSSSCAASAAGACDPATIVVKDKCYWEKNRACDALGCTPPDECVMHEGTPATVECKKRE
jgi:hypothetical protein